MPGRRLSRYHRRLNLRAALVRATIAEVEGRLSRYGSDDLDFAQAVVRDCRDAEDADMILDEIRRHHGEREAGADNPSAAWVRELHDSPVNAFLEHTIQTISAWQLQCPGEGSR